MTFNAAVFHTKIKDLQVTVDAGSCSSRLVFNVPKAHTTGVEAEFSLTPLAGLELSLAGSYVSAEVRFDDRHAVLAGRTGIREGNRLPTVPKFQMAATATYGQRFRQWRLVCSASYQHVGNRYTQPGDQEPGRWFQFCRRQPVVVLRSCHRRVRGRDTTIDRAAAVLQFVQPLGRDRIRQRDRGDRLREQPLRRESPCSRSTASAAGGRGSATTSAQPRTVGLTVRQVVRIGAGAGRAGRGPPPPPPPPRRPRPAPTAR